MPRYKNINGQRIQCTLEEETRMDNVHAAAAVEAPARNAQAEIHRLEGQITNRRLREAYSDPTWMNAQEALIATERAKL